MRRITPWIINSVAGLALIAGGVWALPQLRTLDGWSTMPEQAAESLSAVGLSVEQVLVTGRVETEAADILDALGAVRGAPILDIDVPAAKSRISALPWVKAVEIVRKLPNSLHITLTEHSAFALWQHDNRYTLIARDGTAIIDIATAPADMPVVVGPDAPAHTDALFAVLEQQEHIQKRVKAAVRFGGRRWNLLLDSMDDGLTIQLPEQNIDAALSGLAALDETHQLLSRAVSEIDLRIEGRLVVQLKDGYAPLPQQSRYTPVERNARSDVGPAPDKEFSKGV